MTILLVDEQIAAEQDANDAVFNRKPGPLKTFFSFNLGEKREY